MTLDLDLDFAKTVTDLRSNPFDTTTQQHPAAPPVFQVPPPPIPHFVDHTCQDKVSIFN